MKIFGGAIVEHNRVRPDLRPRIRVPVVAIYRTMTPAQVLPRRFTPKNEQERRGS